MKKLVPCLVLLSAALGNGCAHGSTPMVCTPAPAAAPVAAPREGIGQDAPNGVVETEETLEPDPLVRSWDRVYVLRRRLLGLVQQRQELPDNLSKLLVPEDFIPYDRDAWGRAIRYTRGSSTFEIRSAGPDGCYDSGDDIIATAAMISPRP
jgi:hypothetical protein